MSNPSLTPTALEKYMRMASAGQVTVALSQEQAAAILQAHDYGIGNLPPQSIELLDQVISTLKSEVWA